MNLRHQLRIGGRILLLALFLVYLFHNLAHGALPLRRVAMRLPYHVLFGAAAPSAMALLPLTARSWVKLRPARPTASHRARDHDN